MEVDVLKRVPVREQDPKVRATIKKRQWQRQADA